MIPNDWCPLDARGSRVATGTYVSGDQPTQYCTFHVPMEFCKDSPVLDENGNPIAGLYHLASEFCPEESIITIGVLDYQRVRASESVVAQDDACLKSSMENNGLCEVHTQAAQEPAEFDPNDSSTWPWDDPSFDPFDETTWPNYDPDREPQDPDH